MNNHLVIQDLLTKLTNVTRCDVEQSFVIHRIASLQNAGPHDLAVVLDRGDASVFDAVDKESIKQSAAGVLLADHEIVAGKKYILVSDVLAVYSALADLFEQQHDRNAQEPRIGNNVVIHPSAVIEQGAMIGDGTKIGAQVFVGKHCAIGSNVLLHPGVKVLDRCVIGKNVIIHSGAVIGSDGFGYQVTKTGLKKIPQVGIVRIGNNVEIGANCMIDRASFDETVIGDGVKMDNGIHIAHNVKVGAYSAILAQTGIAGSVEIGIGCQIGGQVAIKDHVKIGNGVKIVSKSGVMQDLKDNEIVAGIPAMPFSQWKRLTVSLQRLPEAMKAFGNFQAIAGAKKSWWQRLFS